MSRPRRCGTIVGDDPDRLVPGDQGGDPLDAARGRRRDRQPRLARLDPARRGQPGLRRGEDGAGRLIPSAAATYAKEGIRCVVVSPGHVDTPFLRENTAYSPNDPSTSLDNPENYARRVRGTPLGRLVTADDVARAFLFTVSDDGAMLTGSMITVDGGAALS